MLLGHVALRHDPDLLHQGKTSESRNETNQLLALLKAGYGCEIAVGHLQEWAESWTTFILSRPVCSSSLPGDPQVNRH